MDQEELNYYEQKIGRQLMMYLYTKNQEYIEKAVYLVNEFKEEVDKEPETKLKG